MRRITVSVDEATHRHARTRAAELDTSVSALVREFLNRLAPRTARPEARRAGSALERRRRLLDAIFEDFDARGVGLRMADNLPREALYDRSAGSSKGKAAPSAGDDG